MRSGCCWMSQSHLLTNKNRAEEKVCKGFRKKARGITRLGKIKRAKRRGNVGLEMEKDRASFISSGNGGGARRLEYLKPSPQRGDG